MFTQQMQRNIWNCLPSSWLFLTGQRNMQEFYSLYQVYSAYHVYAHGGRMASLDNSGIIGQQWYPSWFKVYRYVYTCALHAANYLKTAGSIYRVQCRLLQCVDYYSGTACSYLCKNSQRYSVYIVIWANVNTGWYWFVYDSNIKLHHNKLCPFSEVL